MLGMLAKQFFTCDSIRLKFLSKSFDNTNLQNIYLTNSFFSSTFNENNQKQEKVINEKVSLINKGTRKETKRKERRKQEKVINEKVSLINKEQEKETKRKERSKENLQSSMNISLLCSENNRNYLTDKGLRLRTTPDVVEFIELCESGEFYESLMTEDVTREQVKIEVYEIWFGKNSYQSQVKDTFGHRFPSIANMLWQLKRTDYRRSSSDSAKFLEQYFHRTHLQAYFSRTTPCSRLYDS